jgi:hypothetical protein
MISPKGLGAEGRKVKCAKCAHIWFVKPSEEDLKSVESVTDTPAATAPVPEKSGLPAVSKTTPILLKLIPVVISLVIIVAAFIFYKSALEKIPGMSAIYQAVGFYKTKGVVFSDIIARKVKTRSGEDLLLRGNIFNTSGEERVLPNLRFIISTQDGTEIFSHTLEYTGRVLAPGEKQSINNTIRNLDSRANYLQLDIGNSIELMAR